MTITHHTAIAEPDDRLRFVYHIVDPKHYDDYLWHRRVEQILVRLNLSLDQEVRKAHEVALAGLEATWYVRGAMHSAYASHAAMQRHVRDLMTDPLHSLITGYARLSVSETAGVAVAFMRGWESRGDRLTSPLCPGACREAEAVGMPQYFCAVAGYCEHWNPEEPPLVLHRRWGSTEVQVRCG